MSEARERVREDQEAMLKAILRIAGHAQTLNGGSLRNTQDALLRKRAWSCSSAWPTLAKSLGSTDFSRLFEAYAREHPYQPSGGALVDGFGFAVWLASMGRLSDHGRIQLLAFRLKYRIRRGTQRKRVVGKLAVCKLRNPPYLLVGLHLPLWRLGWIVRVPLSDRRLA
jgi:hypothetical protein